jgi:4-hydroxybenzoate polyprenyltransferase
MSVASAVDSKNEGWLATSKHFMHLIRFSHTIFALPFALLATAWAYLVPLSDTGSNLPFQWRSLFGIVLCMVAARSFAMAMNRLFDHRWDGENPRTATRHLPAKLLSRTSVVCFSFGCVVAFLISCCLFLPNTLPLLLSLPVLAFWRDIVLLSDLPTSSTFGWVLH